MECDHSRAVASLEQGSSRRSTTSAVTRSRWREGVRGDQPLQTQLAKGTQHGIDVALGQRALDEEGFRRGNEGLAGERAANDVNERFRQMGEIAEGFVLDLLADAERAAEQVGSISLAFVAPFRCGYVNGARSRRHELL